MMGWCTLMCDTRAWSAEQHAAAKRQIEIYKEWIRPLVNHGDLHHISTRPDDQRWDGMEYIDATTGTGVVFAFRGSSAEEAAHAFKLKGLDRAGSYQVWSEDGSVARGKAKGASLMDDGLRVESTEAGSSELIYLRKE
jgi:alpha-galactosidase